MKRIICLLHTGNAIEEAVQFDNQGADAVAYFDYQREEVNHDLLKGITREVDIPLIYGGTIERFEGAKKILYAGASKAFVKSENPEAITDAVNRFGEKIVPGEPAVMDCTGKSLNQLVEEIQAADRNEVYLSNAGEISVMALKRALFDAGVEVNTFASAIDFSEFKRNADGLIPVVAQDYKTSEVLMVAYMNEEAYHKTIETGIMTYYSRSRQELWVKGETSGHYQYVKKLFLDCDNDTILAKVKQVGVACHTGARSCFFQELTSKDYDDRNPLAVFEEVYGVIMDRKNNPKEGSYTNYLFDKGIDKILKKVGEEATEIVIAAKNPDPEEMKYEISDFLYHVMVLMAERGVTWKDITDELADR